MLQIFYGSECATKNYKKNEIQQYARKSLFFYKTAN